MSTKILYCSKCSKSYNVKEEDLKLMKKHYPKFDINSIYNDGCFFKNLKEIKIKDNLQK